MKRSQMFKLLLSFILTACSGDMGNYKKSPEDLHALDLNFTTAQNVNVTSELKAGGQFKRADNFSFEVLSTPTKGTLLLTNPQSGLFLYTPTHNASGTDTFTYRVKNGTKTTTAATVKISISHTNQAPLADAASFSTNQNTDLSLTVSGSDPDGDTLSYILVTPPVHGTLSGTMPNLTYSPAHNYSGSDSFIFKVNDGQLDSSTESVTISVVNTNHAPVATNNNLTTTQNQALTFTLAGTDTDGDSLTYALVTQPSHGTLSGTIPNLTYTPTTGYTGNDSFTFTANDGQVDSTAATISITVNAPAPPPNARPVAVAFTLSVTEDTVKTDTLQASDAEGDAMTFEVVTQPTKGVVAITNTSTGAFTFTPTLNETGADSFTYRAKDAGGNSATVTVTVSIAAVNDAPVANNMSWDNQLDSPYSGTLSASDVEGDTLTYTITQNPAHGTVTLSGNAFTYTPSAGYFGGDLFKFRVNDGTTNSNVATATIDIKNWHLFGWAKRRKLLINSPVTSTLSNFPMMIKLDSSKIDYAAMKAGGMDLRILSNGGVLLDYEIENWNPAGISTVWVKVPSISGNATNLNLWIYYGNTAASVTDAQNPAGVWTNGYTAVYHFNNGKSSVNSSYELTAHNITYTAGTVGDFAAFDGTSSYFEMPTLPAAVFNAGYSIEILSAPTAVKSYARLFEFGNGANADNIALQRSGTTDELIFEVVKGAPGPAYNTSLTPYYTVGGGHYVALTHATNGTVNSQFNNKANFSSSISFPNNLDRTLNFLGKSPWPGDELFEGAMDEVRISSVVRSADWLKASYASIMDAMNMVGNEETPSTSQALRSRLLRIKQDSHDGIIIRYNNYWSSNENGYLFAGDGQNQDGWSYLTFTMPQAYNASTTVENLRLKTYNTNNSVLGAGDDLKVVGARVANASLPTSSSNYPGGSFTATTQTVTWSTTSNWSVDRWNVSPNLKLILQEIISSQSGLANGANFQLWMTRGPNMAQDHYAGFYDFGSASGMQTLLLLETQY